MNSIVVNEHEILIQLQILLKMSLMLDFVFYNNAPLRKHYISNSLCKILWKGKMFRHTSMGGSWVTTERIQTYQFLLMQYILVFKPFINGYTLKTNIICCPQHEYQKGTTSKLWCEPNILEVLVRTQFLQGYKMVMFQIIATNSG